VKAIYLLIGMGFTGLVVSSSQAQPKLKPLLNIKREFVCYDTDSLFKELNQTFKEVPFTIGKTHDPSGSAMSLWINPATKTWTIVASDRDISCVIGNGSEIELLQKSRGNSI
jgi:hypothetical protein